MNDLSPPGRAVLDAARGTRPASADRARIRSKLDARLALGAAVGAAAVASTASAAVSSGATAGAAVAPAAASTVTAAATTSVAIKVGGFGLLSKIGLAVLVLGATGAGIRAWVSSSTPPPAPSAVVAFAADTVAVAIEEPPIATAEASAIPSAAMSASEAEPSAKPDASAPRAPIASARPAAGGRDAVSIAAEVALLRSAQNALKDGDGEASLRAIDSLAAKHPDGAMREDGQAARVLALCSLGRVDEARAAAAGFLAEFPRSVHAAQVRGSCAGR